jgi:hypothetical protein
VGGTGRGGGDGAVGEAEAREGSLGLALGSPIVMPNSKPLRLLAKLWEADRLPALA